jgi:hypothetical protein
MPKADIFAVFLVGIALMVLLISLKQQYFKKIIFLPAIAVLLVNYYINRSFYPQLLEYQAESEVAYYMKSHNLKKEKLVTLGVREEMISFLQDRIVPSYELQTVSPKDLYGKYVFTDQNGLENLQSMDLTLQLVEIFEDFRITVLKGTFLNKSTRNEATEKRYLLKVVDKG